MSDNGYDNGIQLNVNLGNGELVNLRARDGEQLAEITETFKKNAEAIAENVVDIKQVFLARNVNSGLASSAPATVSASTAQHSSNSPASSVRCKHGETKDLLGKKNAQGKLYQWRYYCSAGWNATDKCDAEDITGNVKQVP